MKQHQKPMVTITQPLRFMKKGEIGYIPSAALAIVIKSGDCIENLELEVYILKPAGFLSFPSEGFIKIEKIGDEFKSKDFLLDFSEAPTCTPLERYEFESRVDFQKGWYMDPISVDWKLLDLEEYHFYNVDISNYTMSELESHAFKYQTLDNFTKHKESAYKILEILPQKVEEYLDECDTDGILLALDSYKMYLEGNKESLPKGAFKEFALKVQQTIVDNIELYLKKKDLELIEKDLSVMDITSLEQALEEAEKKEDYELMRKISNQLENLRKQ
ncbi:TPA: hypothetical protein DEP21_02130 [Patescibacteria group bacterium]|nr:hypothetical protein [Candidatus Gracilibacteria bacterium]